LRRRKDARYTHPSEQVRVKKADRLRIVQMPVVREVAPQQAESQAAKQAPTGGQA
jgi:NADH-quinone oxidoreductase subunit J